MSLTITTKTTDLDGVFEIIAEGWDGRILRMTRSSFDEWKKDNNNKEKVAAYAIYADHFDKEQYGSELYIGHTGSVDSRIDKHSSDKDYWSVVLIFVSENDWMNVAYTQNIEHRFIKWAKFANRYNVKNGNDGSTTHIGEEDQIRLEEYLSNVREILRMSGIDIFEQNLDGLYINEEKMHGKHVKSSIRILNHEEKLLEIVSGSEISFLDENVVSQAKLTEVEFEKEKKIHKFGVNTMIKPDMTVIPKLLGRSLNKWRSNCGVKLSDVLKDN